MSTPETTRAQVATMFVTYLDEKRRGRDEGIHGRVWAPAGEPTEQLVWIYLTDKRRKKRKRFGQEVIVQEQRALGYVQLGRDGRIWLSNLTTNLPKIARMLDKSIGGIEVLVAGQEGTIERRPLQVVTGRRHVDD